MSGWGSGAEGWWGPDDTVAGARLLYFNRDVPNFRALVDVMDYRFAEVQAVARQVQIGYDLDTAVGEQLDVLGAALGQAREGMLDTRYRRALRVQRALLAAGGTRAAIIATWTDWATVVPISYHSTPPAEFWISGLVDPADEILMARFLRRAAPAGVVINGYAADLDETMLLGDYSLDTIADVEWRPSMETLLDPVSGVQGSVGGSVPYDAAGGFRTFTNNTSDALDWANPAVLTAMTYSGWVRLGAYGGNEHFFFTILSSAGLWGRYFEIRSAGQLYYIHDYSTTDKVRVSINTTGLDDGNWHHIAVTDDGTASGAGVHIYIDGIELTYTTTTNGTGTPDPLDGVWRFGNYSTVAFAWDGDMRELAVWPRALTADEILTVMSEYDPADHDDYTDPGDTDYSADPITDAAIVAARIT